MQLYEASNQWSRRPADERFWTVEEMLRVCEEYRANAAESQIAYGQLEVAEDEGELKLLGKTEVAKFSHWGFGQLCSRIGAPASYIRSLPAEVAAPVVNYGLQAKGNDGANLLFHRNGGLIARAFTSGQYDRIWNSDVCKRLVSLTGEGWRTPPAICVDPNCPQARRATAQDLTRSTLVKEGDLIGPAGLYASDHDMFAFMVNDDCRIDDGSDGGISRGFFVKNSEVGAAALEFVGFGFKHSCGNHIVWGAKDVYKIRIIHRGNASLRYSRELVAELTKYSNASTSIEQGIIAKSQKQVIGADKDAVIDALFSRRVDSRKTLEAAYGAAVKQSDQEGNRWSPRSTWGMAQGLTAISQGQEFADNRVDLDRKAGRILQMTF